MRFRVAGRLDRSGMGAASAVLTPDLAGACLLRHERGSGHSGAPRPIGRNQRGADVLRLAARGVAGFSPRSGFRPWRDISDPSKADTGRWDSQTEYALIAGPQPGVRTPIASEDAILRGRRLVHDTDSLAIGECIPQLPRATFGRAGTAEVELCPEARGERFRLDVLDMFCFAG